MLSDDAIELTFCVRTERFKAEPDPPCTGGGADRCVAVRPDHPRRQYRVRRCRFVSPRLVAMGGSKMNLYGAFQRLRLVLRDEAGAGTAEIDDLRRNPGAGFLAQDGAQTGG